MSSSPLSLHAGPGVGFEAPFEMLEACHEHVRRMLGLLQRLGMHLEAAGADASARQAARDVMRYFDLAGPAHHEDEERHVLPVLRALGDAGARALADRLHADHEAMGAAWSAVRAELQPLADDGLAPADLAAARARWQAFAALYDDHIAAEETEAYPRTRAAIAPATEAEMGREMARRRGAPRPVA